MTPAYNDYLTHYNNHNNNVYRMDPEGQDLDVPLLSSIPDCIDSIKIFPFVIHLKRDVIVSTVLQRQLDPLCASNFLFLSDVFPSLESCREI